MSTHAIFRPPAPSNEPILGYAPGSPERGRLQRRLDEMKNERIEIPLVIDGKDVTTGDLKQAVMPHDKAHVLADVHQGNADHVQQARRGTTGRGRRGRTAPPCSSAQRSSCPGRGGRR
jgi:1-pyrroline-5-carboxylate dehydrogenase